MSTWIVLSFDGRTCCAGLSGNSVPITVTSFNTKDLERRSTHVSDNIFLTLQQKLSQLIFRNLRVGIRGRRIGVVWPRQSWTTIFEHTLKQVLNDMGATAISFIPFASAVLYPLSIRTALVVQIGLAQSIITPVINGYALRCGMSHTKLGLDAIMAAWREDTPHLDDDVNFINRFAVVKQHSEREKSEEFSPVLKINDKCVSLHSVHKATEVLFGLNEENESIIDSIITALRKTPIDSRELLSSRILLCGPLADLPGLAARTLFELRKRFRAPGETQLKGLANRISCLDLPAPADILPWLGVSIVCASGARDTPCEDIDIDTVSLGDISMEPRNLEER